MSEFINKSVNEFFHKRAEYVEKKITDIKIDIEVKDGITFCLAHGTIQNRFKNVVYLMWVWEECSARPAWENSNVLDKEYYTMANLKEMAANYFQHMSNKITALI